MSHPMLHPARRARAATWLVFPLAALSALAACEDDPTGPEEPEIGTVRLTIGTQTVSLTRGQTASVTVGGASNAVSATFLGDDGSSLTLNGDEFELRLLPQTAGRVSYSGTTPFAGTLTRVSTGTVVVNVEIFHKIENHADFTAILNMTVQ